MIEIIPPVDPAEELRKQWANEVKAKIDKMNRRSSKPYEFEKELENAKKELEKSKQEAIGKIHNTRCGNSIASSSVMLHSL